jgi:hypothetical protein
MARPMPRSIPSLSPAFKARSGKIVRFSDASEGLTSLYRPSPSRPILQGAERDMVNRADEQDCQLTDLKPKSCRTILHFPTVSCTSS